MAALPAAACDPGRIRGALNPLRGWRPAVLCGLLMLILSLTLTTRPACAQSGGLQIPGQLPPRSGVVRPEPPDESLPPLPTTDGGQIDVPPASDEAPALPEGPLQRMPIGDGDPPDYLEATSIVQEADGGFTATGVTLSVQSLVQNGGPAVLTADRAIYKPSPLAVELIGAVELRVEGAPLELQAEYIRYDAATRTLAVEALRLPVPLSAILEDGIVSEPIRARFAPNVRVGSPDTVYLNADSIELVQREAGRVEAVAQRVQLSASPKPRPDLFVRVRELTYGGEGDIVARGLALYLEGHRIFSWGKYSRLAGARRGIIEFDAPSVNAQLNRFAIRQDITLTLDPLTVETHLDYDTERGDLLAHGYALFPPVPGAQLGVSAGTRRDSDIFRRAVERTERYNAVYRHAIDAHPWRWNLAAEHGDMRVSLFDDEGAALSTVEAQRTHLFGDVELEALGLNSDVYLTLGATGSFTDYGEQNYNVTGGRAGLIYRRRGFNNFVLYRHNLVSGTPVFAFDQVRERELNVQARLSLIPRLNHIVRGVYDFDLDDWDRLELASLIERETYEVGFYWDFARERAGFEFGLFVP